MDRSQVYATFDTFMAAKTYSHVLGGSFTLSQGVLDRLSCHKGEGLISVSRLISGWDLFEKCVEDIIELMQIPNRDQLARMITDAIADEVDLYDYISSSQHSIMRDILEYAGLDPCKHPLFTDLLTMLLDLISSWGAFVPSSVYM